MERGRHRKSKSASGIEGVRQIQRLKSVSRLSSDSRSYIDGSSREDKFVLDLGQSSLGRAKGTPMKKLLTEEMSKEVELKKRPASVIARLMGLYGSASPKDVNRQQKRPSWSYQQKNVSVNIQENSKLYDSLLTRRSSVEHQDFKDVYEDLEASHLVNRRSSRWSASSMLTKAEMALIQQKFIDAKLRSTNKKLQDSKALDDALEMLDCNKDLLLQFLQEPDSFFRKNMHNHSTSSLGSNIAVLRPSSTKHKGNSKAWNLQPESSSRHEITSHLTRKDGLLLEAHNRNRSFVSRQSSNFELQKNENKIHPTRIVILKPNKIQNSRVSGLSPEKVHDLHNFKKMKEYPSDELAEMVSFRKNDSSRNVGVSKPISKDAREIARRIARRMREGYEETIDTKSTKLRGYAGDESSFEANESESDYESEVFRLLTEKGFGDSKLRRHPSSRVANSSVNKEAKQRLSERWKMTQRYQDLEMVKGSTLGEMLALHDGEIMPKQLDAETSRDSGCGIRYGPYGISSRDGREDETRKTSSKSISLPPSIRGKSHKRSTHHDQSKEDKHLMCNYPFDSSRSKVVKGNLIHEGDVSLNCSRSRNKKPLPYQHLFTIERDTISEASFEIEMEAKIKDLPEDQPIFQIAEKNDTTGSPVFDVKMIAEHGSKTLSSKSHEFLPHESSLVANEGKAVSQDLGDSSLQELAEGLPEQASPFQIVRSEPSCTKNSKESNHASPVSVLEVSFTEDTPSSSESFERVGAELHELRMQLQLLKMESGTYIEEEIVSGGNHVFGEECWEISYALDVLQESGLEDSVFDIFKTKWHSPDCPLDLKLFDELEKKYNAETSGLSSERRLIFDRTNVALLDILWEKKVDLFPWVKPKLAGFKSCSPNEGVRVVIDNLMSNDYPNGGLSAEAVLDKEMQWPDFKGEIDAIGNEIEKLLIDDMIVEVVCN